MKRIIYIHGKGGNAQEAEHYQSLFAESEVIGFDYKAETPWEAKEEFSRFYEEQSKDCDAVVLIANSIGAFFAMHALADKTISKAYFISPIVDMETLISDMMRWANVTEDQLKQEREIPTSFGETLSWEYLCYVRKHPITWKIATDILYGENDHLTSKETISAFAHQIGAKLTVAKQAEHWFHTQEQMDILDNWIQTAKNA